MKVAAMEASFHTEPAPAPWTVIAIRVPTACDLAAASAVGGRADYHALAHRRTRRHRGTGIACRRTHPLGMIAYEALQQIRADGSDQEARALFEETWRNLAMACCSSVIAMTSPTRPRGDRPAARDTVPDVWPCSGPSAL